MHGEPAWFFTALQQNAPTCPDTIIYDSSDSLWINSREWGKDRRSFPRKAALDRVFFFRSVRPRVLWAGFAPLGTISSIEERETD